MNHLFKDVSWLHYSELLAFALLIYYLYIVLGWYRPNIVKLFTDERRSETPQQVTTPQLQSSDVRSFVGIAPSAQVRPEQPELAEFEMLTTALLAAIAERSGGPYEPAAMALQLKAIIGRYPQLRNSPHRAAINNLVVAECKKNGIAELSEEVVDGWWQF